MKTLHIVAPRRIGNEYYKGRDATIAQMLKATSGIPMYNQENKEINSTGDWDVVCDDDALIGEEESI